MDDDNNNDNDNGAAAAAPVEPPLPASLLLDREIARREGLAARGNLATGCRELDEYVLLGGLERGSVVGVSAEDDGGGGIGLLIGLQTVAHLLASEPAARAMVVTTLPPAALLPKLRKALVGQLVKVQGAWRGVQAGLRACLERISISRVFDIEGLWEVLGELEAAVPVSDGEPSRAAQTGKGTEMLNSGDEGGRSSPGSPSPTPPDIVLVTHTSALLNALFTGRDKDAAHNTTLLLASRLRALARSPAHAAPLFMLLNSTTSPAALPPQPPAADDAPPAAASGDTPGPPSRHVDSTLRSIFGPAPPAAQHDAGASAAAASSARRNKPSFGPVFAQMLDLHLLCTRVPRTRADGAALAAHPGTSVADVSHVWVVEVLLDELGVYERRQGDGGGERFEWGERRSREQRWAVVDVVDEDGAVVDATVP
ncbi:hypothetical protein VTH06DRAFT_8604 [Thermothelomyces fergusii]